GPPAPSLQEGARMLGACPRRLAECWRLTARYAKRSGGGWVKCLRNYARRTGDRGRLATSHTMMMTAMAISPMMRNVLSVATMLPPSGSLIGWPPGVCALSMNLRRPGSGKRDRRAARSHLPAHARLHHGLNGPYEQEQTAMITSRAERAQAAQAASGAVTLLGRLGAWSMRHRWLVVAGWVVVLVAATSAARLAGSQVKTDLTGGNTQSQQAASFRRDPFPGQAGDTAQIVFATRAPVTSAADRSRIGQTLAGLSGLPQVASVRGPFSRGAAHQVSPDGHVAYGVVQFDRGGDELPGAAIQRVITRARAAAAPGFKVQLGGAPIQKTENAAFGASEAAGILAAVVILLLAFGSVIAMALPIVTAIAAVATTFGVLDMVSHAVTVPTFGPEL